MDETPSRLEKFILLQDIQNNIENIVEAEVDNTALKINRFVEDSLENFLAFYSIVFSCMKSKRRNYKLYGSLFSSIDQHYHNWIRSFIIDPALKPNYEIYIDNCFAHAQILRIFFYAGLVSIEEINQAIFSQYSMKREGSLKGSILLAFFLNEFATAHPDMFKEIQFCFARKTKYYSFHDLIENFLYTAINYSPSQLEEIYENGYLSNTIEGAIATDNIDNLVSLVSKNENFQSQAKIRFSLFDIKQYSIFPSDEVYLISFAAFHGSIKCFKYLLLNGGLNKQDRNILEFAIIGGNDEIIQNIEMVGIDIREKREVLERTFYSSKAALCHHFDIMNYIIEKEEESCSLLLDAFFSSAKSNFVQGIFYCLEKGVNINSKNSFGLNALMIAIQNRSYAVMALLIDKKISLTDSTKNGWTVVHYAAVSSEIHSLKLLLPHLTKSDLDKQNDEGFTPADCAAKCKKLDNYYFINNELENQSE